MGIVKSSHPEELLDAIRVPPVLRRKIDFLRLTGAQRPHVAHSGLCFRKATGKTETMNKNFFPRLDTVSALVVYIFASFLVAFVIPGIVALLSNSYEHKDLVQFLLQSNSPRHAEVKGWLQTLNSLEDNLKRQEAIPFEPDQSPKLILDAIKERVDLREAYGNMAKQRTISAYANSRTRIYFFVYFCFLGMALFNCKIDWTDQATLRNALSWTWFYYVLFAPVNWVRNTDLGSEGRRIYSHAHFDISPSGFFCQEVEVFLLLLLAGLFTAFSSREKKFWLVQGSVSSHSSGLSKSDLGNISSCFESEFRTTQLRLFFTGCAFLPWAYFFWQASATHNDSRYIASAISLQTIWFIIWGIVISRAIEAFSNWNRLRNAYLCNSSDPENSAKLFSAINPVSTSSVAPTVVISTLSFLFPMLKALFS